MPLGRTIGALRRGLLEPAFYRRQINWWTWRWANSAKNNNGRFLYEGTIAFMLGAYFFGVRSMEYDHIRHEDHMIRDALAHHTPEAKQFLLDIDDDFKETMYPAP